MISLAALTQAITNTSPLAGAANFFDNSTTNNIPSPRCTTSLIQNNTVPFAKIPSSTVNSEFVDSSQPSDKKPMASFFKWLGTKVLPDAIMTFLTGLTTYGMAHYAVATATKRAFWRNIPGLKGFHEKVIKINDAIKDHLGEEKYLDIASGMRRPGSHNSVKAYWKAFDQIKSQLADKQILSKSFLDNFQNIFQRYKQWVAGILISVLSYVRAVFFTPVKDGNDPIEPFSISSLMAGILPLFVAGLYWTVYDYLPISGFLNKETDRFKFGSFEIQRGVKLPSGKKHGGYSLQGSMDYLIETLKATTKALKKIDINLSKPQETITSGLISFFLSASSRDLRREGLYQRTFFQKTEDLVNTILKPLKKEVKFSKKLTEFPGLENILDVPGLGKEKNEKMKDLNPGFDPDSLDCEFVLIAAFKTGLKVICDSLLFSFFWKWINSNFFNKEDDKKKKKVESTSESQIKSQSLNPLQTSALMGLSFAAMSSAPALLSNLEDSRNKNKMAKQSSFYS